MSLTLISCGKGWKWYRVCLASLREHWGLSHPGVRLPSLAVPLGSDDESVEQRGPLVPLSFISYTKGDTPFQETPPAAKFSLSLWVPFILISLLAA